MAQNINQFAQTPVDGQLDLSFMGSVVSARVANSVVTPFVAGQAVAGDTTTPGTAQDGPPSCIALANNAMPCLGFVVGNIKDINRPANSNFELAMEGSVMYKTSSSTIARFAPVEYDIATNTVLAWGGINSICGYAYDAAVTSGDLIRIMVRTPQLSQNASGSTVKSQSFTVTLAQINAGAVLISGIAGKKITVTDYTFRVNGASFAGGTNILLESTNGTPVVVSTIAEAGLVTTAVLKPTSANTTLGAGFSIPLGTGDGLQIASTGTQTTATGANVTLSYIQA